jgi:hypothetical protein
LGDAVEIRVLIALLKGQNEGAVNKRLTEARAGRAALAFRNALIARLVLLVARAYAEPRDGDQHVHAAACLLKDKVTREIFETGDGAQKLAEFDAHWAKCRGDHRLPPIKLFRDKYTAHVGKPKEIQ